MEDTVCGGMLLEAVGAKADAEVERAVSLWRAHEGKLAQMMKRASDHGRSLMALGFERDIEFAARRDVYDLIPIREGDSIVRKVT